MPIFDQGYQHWQGQLSGPTWRWWAIVRHGVSVQMKNRVVRLLLLFAWLPALGLVAGVALWGLVEQKNGSAMSIMQFLGVPGEILQGAKDYRGTIWTLIYWRFFQVELFFIMLVVLIAGPGLISRDLRFNALSLYLSRPLSRFDYFLGKLGVIAVLVAAVAVVPAVIAYFIGVVFSLELSVVKDTYHVLLASVAYGAVVTLSVGTLILALSSLTRRSMYVGIAWAGIWIITWPIGIILSTWHGESGRHEARERVIRQWVNDHPPPPGVQMAGTMPTMQIQPDGRQRLAGVTPEQEPAANAWFQQRMEVERMSWDAARQESRESLQSDWGRLFSFPSNLNRLADAMLDADAAWVQIGKAEAKMAGGFTPRGRVPSGLIIEPDERRLANEFVYQFPWYWSAGVLAGLMGLSAWILHRRVKSLDRLK